MMPVLRGPRGKEGDVAHVVKRPDREYYYAHFRGEDGKYHRKCTRLTDKEAAKRLAAKLENEAQEIRQGIRRHDAPLDEVVERFLQDRELRTRKETFERYRQELDRVISRLKVDEVIQIQPYAVMAYREGRMNKDGVGKRVVNKEIGALKTCLNWAWREARLINDNPISNLKPLPHKAARRRALDPEECQRLLEASPEPYRSIWEFFLHTGLRNSELVELTWRRVDLRNRVIVIPAEGDKPGSRSKNHREGVIRLDDRALTILRSQPMMGPDAFVFRNPRRTRQNRAGRFRREGLAQALRKHLTVAKVDLTGVDVHALRVAFGSLLIRGGANPKAVQRAMRHETFSQTMDLYARAFEDDEQRAVDRNPLNFPVGITPILPQRVEKATEKEPEKIAMS
jgi:integrase